MGFWVWAIVTVALNVIRGVLRPKGPGRPSPASLSDLNIPTTAEGRRIPLVYGTCLLESPMVAWYGDFSAEPHVYSVHHVWGWENQDYGFNYWLGMQLVLCSGVIDKVIQVRFDDEIPTHVIRAETADYTDLDFDDLELYGGGEPPGEGGILGNIRIYHGTTTQEANSYLCEKVPWAWSPWTRVVPAYHGIAYAVVGTPFCMGLSPFLKTISFVVRRCPNGLGLQTGEVNINGDANPAAMIYDILTAPSGSPGMPAYGLGIPIAMIDTQAFQDAGEALAAEGLGLSMVFDGPQSAKDAIATILDHIDGVVYREPLTGLLTIKLIRQDYEEEELPILDESNCELESFSRPAIATLRNTVRVSYVERGTVDEQGVEE
jgi:hypothetical protein